MGRINMSKILLCGANGKMGHTIESCIRERDNMEIIAGIDINTNAYADFPIYSSFKEVKERPDVIIDFSNPAILNALLEYATENRIPLVAATTGYSQEQISFIKGAAEKTAVFFTFNMSLGINLLLDLGKRAAMILGEQFDIEIVEKHHNQKIDAPSGTAFMIAEALNEVSDNKYQYEYDRHSKRAKRSPSEIGIHSVRGGTIVGEHEVIFAGRDEILSLKHSAMSKEIFAVGAVNAASYLAGKTRGLYDMGSLLSEKE